jgi:hypothetical protein
VASDDWRIRIELPAEEHAHGLLGRLHGGVSSNSERLVQDLKGRRLAVSRDESTVFVYGESRAQAEQALAIVESELAEDQIEPVSKRIEQWLADEERWDDEPPGDSWEEEQIERGFAPWEVRVECESHGAATDLADRLEAEGRAVVRRYNFIVVGTETEDEARELAAEVGGEVEVGGELVWEDGAPNPFAVFDRFRK